MRRIVASLVFVAVLSIGTTSRSQIQIDPNVTIHINSDSLLILSDSGFALPEDDVSELDHLRHSLPHKHSDTNVPKFVTFNHYAINDKPRITKDYYFDGKKRYYIANPDAHGKDLAILGIGDRRITKDYYFDGNKRYYIENPNSQNSMMQGSIELPKSKLP